MSKSQMKTPEERNLCSVLLGHLWPMCLSVYTDHAEVDSTSYRCFTQVHPEVSDTRVGHRKIRVARSNWLLYPTAVLWCYVTPGDLSHPTSIILFFFQRWPYTFLLPSKTPSSSTVLTFDTQKIFHTRLHLFCFHFACNASGTCFYYHTFHCRFPADLWSLRTDINTFAFRHGWTTLNFKHRLASETVNASWGRRAKTGLKTNVIANKVSISFKWEANCLNRKY